MDIGAYSFMVVLLGIGWVTGFVCGRSFEASIQARIQGFKGKR